MVATTLTAVAEAAKDCRVLVWNVRNMLKNELKHHEKVFRSGLCVEPCCEWCGLRA